VGSGDNVVVPSGEHWNNTFPWLALRARGVDARGPLGATGASTAIGRRVDGRMRRRGVRGQSPDGFRLTRASAASPDHGAFL
jgi:hypothetical protein